MPQKKTERPSWLKRPRLSKMPTTMGGLADARYKLNQQKSALKAELSLIEQEAALLEDAIFARLKVEETDTAIGKLSSVKKSKRPIYKVPEWEDVFSWVKKGKGLDRFSIMYRQLSIRALVDLRDSGKPVPGVELDELDVLSVTKRK